MNFKQLPKIDLHLHLDGAIRVPTIAELGDELGIKLPTNDPKKLAKFVQVDRDCRSLGDFLKRFEVFYPLLPFAKTQERIAYELCEDCMRDNVIYFEARFAPALAASKKFTMEDAVVAALEGFRRGQRDFAVRCGVILCCYRSISVQENIATVKLAQKYRDKGVIGIDLAEMKIISPPRRTPRHLRWRESLKSRSRFTRAKAAGRKIFARLSSRTARRASATA